MASSPFQLIDSRDHFKKDDLKSFVTQTKFSGHGKSYSVVSIIGPRYSGKSTLVNHLFGTKFETMGTSNRGFQTTQGIWMAKCERDDIKPFTIVMDIEGTNGREKEGDTTFTEQSALFALEISNFLIFSMWSTDISRHVAGNRVLLIAVFKFMVQLFKPHKTTLLFVLRDKGETSLKKLSTSLERDIQEIWDKVRKPEAHKNAPFSKFFQVEIAALPSYEHDKKQFKQEVAAVRRRFFSSASDSQGRGVVSASDFSNYAQKIWNLITQIRDLNISSVQAMVSTIRCDGIIQDKLDGLSVAQLDNAIQAGPQNFAEELRSILDTCYIEYNKKTRCYDEGIRTAKREYLEAKVLELLHPAYRRMVKHISDKAFESFRTGLKQMLNKRKHKRKDFAASVGTLEKSCVLEFEKGCKDATLRRVRWDDASASQEALIQAMKAHALSVCVKNHSCCWF